MTSTSPICDRVELAIVAHLRRAPYIGGGPLRTTRKDSMSPDRAPLHEYWQKLARLIIDETDAEKKQEWVDQLVISYQEEKLRLESHTWVN